jgi:hypothetical protein
MKTLTLYRLLLYVSLFSLAYFIYLVYIFYYPPTDGYVIHAIQFIGELITIPLLLVTVFNFIFSLYKIIKEIEVKKYLIVFILNTATIVFLGVVTYADLNHRL